MPPMSVGFRSVASKAWNNYFLHPDESWGTHNQREDPTFFNLRCVSAALHSVLTSSTPVLKQIFPVTSLNCRVTSRGSFCHWFVATSEMFNISLTSPSSSPLKECRGSPASRHQPLCASGTTRWWRVRSTRTWCLSPGGRKTASLWSSTPGLSSCPVVPWWSVTPQRLTLDFTAVWWRMWGRQSPVTRGSSRSCQVIWAQQVKCFH